MEHHLIIAALFMMHAITDFLSHGWGAVAQIFDISDPQI
jgi:hypothetical protein